MIYDNVCEQIGMQMRKDNCDEIESHNHRSNLYEITYAVVDSI